MAAVVAVGLVIGGLRFFVKNPNSGAGPSTTGTQSASSSGHGGQAAVPVSAAQLTQFKGYAATLQQANQAASTGLGANGTPTTTQVAAVVTSYRTAVALYDTQLHSISWPTSMQAKVDVDHAQLEALISFLQSFNSVTPTGMSAWLSQLHNRTGTAVRRQPGPPGPRTAEYIRISLIDVAVTFTRRSGNFSVFFELVRGCQMFASFTFFSRFRRALVA